MWVSQTHPGGSYWRRRSRGAASTRPAHPTQQRPGTSCTLKCCASSGPVCPCSSEQKHLFSCSVTLQTTEGGDRDVLNYSLREGKSSFSRKQKRRVLQVRNCNKQSIHHSCQTPPRPHHQGSGRKGTDTPSGNTTHLDTQTPQPHCRCVTAALRAGMAACHTIRLSPQNHHQKQEKQTSVGRYRVGSGSTGLAGNKACMMLPPCLFLPQVPAHTAEKRVP